MRDETTGVLVRFFVLCNVLKGRSVADSGFLLMFPVASNRNWGDVGSTKVRGSGVPEGVSRYRRSLWEVGEGYQSPVSE